MACALAFGLVGSLAAAERGVTANKIVLGEVSPMSGGPSIIGKAHHLGVAVWEQDVNARGGINGRKVEVRVEDDGYVPQRSVQSLRKLIDVDEIFGLVGTSGASHLMAMLPLIEEMNLPTVNTIGVVTQHFTPIRKSVFNIGPTYAQEITAGMKELVRQRKLEAAKFGLVYQDDDSGADIKLGYEDALKGLKLKSTVEAPYKRGTKDFSSEALRLKQAGATFVMIGGIITDTSTTLKEMAKNQMTAVTLAPHYSNFPVVLSLAGPAAEDLHIADYVPPLNDTQVPGIAKFMALAKKYLSPDEQKSLNRYSVTAYVGGLVMEEAVRACGAEVTNACVIAKLENLKNFGTEGLMSPISFSPTNRHMPSAAILLKADLTTGTYVKISDFIPVE